MNLNRAELIGRLTRDPETKALPSGVIVSSFSLATNNVYKDKAGVKQETTDFHNCVAFGALAEKVIGPYAKKGQEVYVAGRIQTRSWDDKEGKKQYRTEIVISEFQLGAKPKGSEGGSAPSYNRGNPEPTDVIEYPDEDINPDDIPF